MTVCKVKIQIDSSFVAFVCAYYFFNPMKTFWPFLFSAALHEGGHLLAMFLCDVKVHTLRLRASGAVISADAMPYWKELLVAAAGPFVNLLLLLASTRNNALMAVVNLCLFVYNLLPIYPLDGGRILHALMYMLLPPNAAETMIKTVQILCVGAIVLLSCYMTCVWHAGLWPMIVAGMLLLRVGEMILPQKRKKSV